MNKDIPIIFSGPMVRALLDGRKTMTRRILKPQPEPFAIDVGTERERQCDVGLLHVVNDPRPRVTLGRVITRQEVRYAAGDRLYVREAWCPANSDDGPVLLTRADTGRRYLVHESYPVDYDKFPAGRGAWSAWASDVEAEETTKAWRPSIHMPRWASRLTLIVADVKIERVQDISDADAIAEGVETWRVGWTQKEAALAFLRGTEAAEATKLGTVAQRLFYLLWTSLHGEDGWKQNPFVVAPSFRVIKANIDAPEARFAA